MKLSHIAGLALAGFCMISTSMAYADNTVAVMKIDALGDNTDKTADMMLQALQKEMKNTEYTLDANGSDITYSEMQMVTGCDKDGSIVCYDAACETLGAPAIIMGSVKDGGETHLVWYIRGKGIFREVNGKADSAESVNRLAKEMVVGDVGKVIVTSNVPGADVFIDGKRVGMSAEFEETATPIELVTGNYIVQVRKEGFTANDDTVKVTIEKDNVAHIHVDMSVTRDPEEVRKAVLIGGYSSLGVAAAAIIAGGVLTGLTFKGGSYGDNGKSKMAEDIQDALEAGDVAEMDRLEDKASAMFVAGEAMLGVGGFFLAAGIALVVTGFVYDFAGEDVDAAYSKNSLLPKVNFNLSPDYQGMTMGWSF